MTKRKRSIFTTREVGVYCGVDLTTVINWIKAGRLKAYKTAGGHRRIREAELKKFMKKYSMPMPPDLEDRKLQVLVISDDNTLLESVREALQDRPETEISSTGDILKAGYMLAVLQPDTVIIDSDYYEKICVKMLEILDNTENEAYFILIRRDLFKETDICLFSAGRGAFVKYPFTAGGLIDKIDRKST
ncbi:MAG: helix-turn-helix domain-containing protein [Elusimicrobiota bacterium]